MPSIGSIAPSSFQERGAWVTATSYAAYDATTQGGHRYICNLTHTSGSSFAADLAAGKWIATSVPRYTRFRSAPCYVYGNSYAVGNGASDTAHSLVGLVTTATGANVSNYAVSSTLTADFAKAAVRDNVYPSLADPKGCAIICNPINDVRLTGGSTLNKQLVADSMTALVDLLSCELRVEETDASISYTGTWTSTTGTSASGGSYKYTTTVGDVVTIAFNGSGISVHTFADLTSKSIPVTWAVDGVTVRTVNYGVNRWDGTNPSYSPGIAEVFDGLGDGPHTLTGTLTSGANSKFCIDFLTYPSPNPPRIVVVPALPLTSAAWASSSPYNLGSDALCLVYNRILAGLPRRYPHVRIAAVLGWSSASHLSGDGIHPNDAGHAKIADAILEALN